MKKVLCILTLLLLFKSGFAQKLNISGSIKDAANHPLSMVRSCKTISKKPSEGIAADATGHFSLSVSAGTKILVSAIGYIDTTLTIKDEAPLVIMLRPAENQLANVTVTGSKTGRPQPDDQIKMKYCRLNLYTTLKKTIFQVGA